MYLDIEGRTALVLGAGGGLGGAVAERLAREGVNVALADIDPEKLNATVGMVESHGVKALPITWDLGDLASVDANVSHVEEELGCVNILVVFTGGPPPTPVSGQDHDLWASSFRMMVQSVVAITDRVLPDMRTERWGRIITSTSSGVVAPIPNLGLSNALRGTLLGWSKTLSQEVGLDGITANVVVPGRIATSRTAYLDQKKAERTGRSVKEVVAESAAGMSLGRYGDPAEFADVVAFLASERASYVTGSIVRVDGGLIPSV